MSWYYDQVNGQIAERTGFDKWLIDRDIWTMKHDPIPGQTIYGPFATQAEAEAFKASHPSGVAGVLGIPSASQVTSEVAALLVRIGEIALGIVLLAIAANVILKQSTGVDVGAAGRRAVGKVA